MKKINNRLRIIGGQFRGKIISFPDAPGLRPTPDRVRETLFNWLMHDIRGARCLDLFAGSGALGLEAYSRGAAEVVFVEKDHRVYQYLQQITKSFPSAPLILTHASAEEYLRTSTHAPFDIIFIDPPFAHLDLFDCIHRFETSSLLAPSGLLYVESPHTLSLNPTYWHPLKLKQAGQVTYGLYQKLS